MVIDLKSARLAPVSTELLEACIHCGLCLPACPTYLATGRELESPRGRIYLIAKWQKDSSTIEKASEHISSCLGCLGCQTACPSGVHYEEILENVRPALALRRSLLARVIMRFSFRQLLPHYGRLRFLGALLRFGQKLGLDRLAASLLRGFRDRTGAIAGQGFFARLAVWPMFTPAVPPHVMLDKIVAQENQVSPKAQIGESVQFFQGCIMDVFYNNVNRDAVKCLSRVGTVVLGKQTCCGALAFHAGDVDIAEELAKRNIEAFANTEGDIVVTSAGCGAMLKTYGHMFAADERYAQKARQFSLRVKDFSEAIDETLLSRLPEESRPGKGAQKVAYHAACHLAHAQGVRSEPKAILDALASKGALSQCELPESEHCCGSAGIYNLLNTSLSLKVLERKMDFIEGSGADCVVTANPGCLLQIEAGVKERRLNVKVEHLAQLLARHLD